MRKLIFIFTLVTLFLNIILCSLDSPVIRQGEYSNKAVLDPQLTLYWDSNVKNGTIELALQTTNTNGWSAIAFGHKPDNGMHDADGYMVYASGSEVKLVDVYLVNVGIPPVPDTDKGGSNGVLKSVGAVQGNTLYVKFIRHLNATESTDKTITAGLVNFSWALNDRTKDLTVMHTNRGKTTIDFLSSDNSAVVDPPKESEKTVSFKFHLVATAGLIVILIVAGLLVTLLRINCGASIVYFWFFKRTLFVTKWSLVNDLVRFTVGELFVILIYLAAATSWFLYGYYKTTTYRWGRGLGYVNILNLSLILLPITRHSVWTWIFNISYERAVRFHRFLGVTTLSILTGHAIAMFIYYAKVQSGYAKQIFKWDHSLPINPLAGFITWCIMIALVLVALPFVRRHLWTIFQISHFTFAVGVFTLATFHVGVKLLLPYTAFSFALYLGDLFLRYFAFIGNRNLFSLWRYNLFAGVRNCMITAHVTSGVVSVKLTIDRCLIYRKNVPVETLQEKLRRKCLGQFIFLWVLQVSPWESHPFSITDITVLDKDTVELDLNIKKMTSPGLLCWTGRLYNLAEKSDGKCSVTARFDGPFGSLTVPLESRRRVKQFDLILLFAGGIGITPLNMLTKHCLDSNPNTYLYWTMADQSVAQLLPCLVSIPKHVICHITKSSVADCIEEGENYRIGRPNFEKIIQEHISRLGDQCRRVAIVTCGPNPMINDVLRVCNSLEWKMRHIHFHVHTECFAL
jgi:ferric-chelate reductase